MPTRRQEQQIADAMTLRQLAMSTILAESAQQMAFLVSSETLSKLERTGYSVARADGVTEKIYQDYVAGLNRGGTKCIERVVENIGGGRVRVTTRQRFVPWLNDMTREQSREIISMIGQAERDGVYPLDITKSLKTFFAGTDHRAVTAARTEAAKIRNDARSQSFIDSGVEYVQYVTAGDSEGRPEHAMRDGKISRHEDAPWIGEYNCRCLLVPADYKVEHGAAVTESDAEELTREQLEGREPGAASGESS